MVSIYHYLKGIGNAFYALWVGMRLTLKTMFSPWKILTQQYPENRKTVYIPERFRGELILPHDENNQHKCTACTICEGACPNGTIKITYTLGEGNKKILDKWVYNMGMCTFCSQCVEACPQDAIIMHNAFEHSVYKRNLLIKILNNEGSSLKIKEAVKKEMV